MMLAGANGRERFFRLGVSKVPQNGERFGATIRFRSAHSSKIFIDIYMFIEIF